VQPFAHCFQVAASPAKQDDGEEKKPRSSYFTSVLSREPPAEKGMHPLPTGKDGCLNDLTFVTSGVLRSLESEEAVDLIKRYGGRVTSAVSSKTSYLLLGKDGGKVKSEAAAKHGTKIIDEQQLFAMISASLPTQAAPAPASSSLSSAAAAAVPLPASPASVPSASVKSPAKTKPTPAPLSSTASNAVPSPAAVAPPPLPSASKSSSSVGNTSSSNAAPKCTELWTTKHKPNRIEEIVGNPGKVKELQTWLMTWQRYFADEAAAKAAGDKKKKKDDNFMKAVLISGPPGIGKTTAAHIVARACGFCVLEFNASDVRSKSSLHEHVMALASNTTLAMGAPKPPTGPGAAAVAAAAAPNGFNGKLQKRNCVIMDEVDGMSSGDRGGIAEIIKIIADCKMPIICICNDYYDAKIKSLRNHCLDMRFSKPTVRANEGPSPDGINRILQAIQARARLAAIARIEGLKIEPETALDKMVEISQGDMRHTLNLLQALSLRSQKISWDDVGSASKSGGKDTSSMQSSIFDTVGDWFFSSSKHTSASYSDRAEMFFTDYRLMPLMVQVRHCRCVVFVVCGTLTLNFHTGKLYQSSSCCLARRN
jgi:replication factor C subunit 1